jgi:S-DNA-T family DNA segregation ATPase FtsK/SpoIIIE
MLFLALVSIPLLIPATHGATDLRDSIVRTFGLMVFSFVGLVAYIGLIVVRRRFDETFEDWKPWAIAALLWVVAAGLLGFFRPDWHLGGISLTDVTASGDIGSFLAGNPLGILAWLAAGAAAFAIITPTGAMATMRATGQGLRTAWEWRIERRMAHAAGAVVRVIFPMRTPPHGAEKVPLEAIQRPRKAIEEIERPELDDEEEDEDEEYEDDDDEIEEEAPRVAAARGRQKALPIDGDDEEDEEEELEPLDSKAKRRANDGWQLPPLDVLLDVAPQEGQADSALRARLIEDTLASFGVDAKVVQVNEGPTVTQFGIEPGWEIRTRQVQERDPTGKVLLDRNGQPRVTIEEVSRTRVRVNQITVLGNDMALAMSAPSLRIESPVPGKPFVGIEVPNTSAALVTLRGVVESAQFRRAALKSRLSLALGKSVSGEPVIADLAKMPHLLIAGSTGSGKSVALNSIVACLLMHASPEEVRFVMIDPKRVELAAFSEIPHLAFSSIVIDVDKVVPTLQAVIHEMEARYRRFSALGVRNIESYNKHDKCPTKLPYWVVIIDELADLMMAAPYEVEKQICRLAQLARATGIHLIVATQRPSVDVVTGLIKANFPTRIAFAMSSQVDSRTILDIAGAEKLLGRGDMLFLPTDAAKPRRLQGVYVSDQEIERLVEFWTQDRFQEVDREMFDHLLEQAHEELKREPSTDDDPMFEAAKTLATEHQQISTSMLQRRLRIGYPRAARLMDQLEDEGVVGPPESGGASRKVLIGASSIAVAGDDEDE